MYYIIKQIPGMILMQDQKISILALEKTSKGKIVFYDIVHVVVNCSLGLNRGKGSQLEHGEICNVSSKSSSSRMWKSFNQVLIQPF